MKQLLSSCFALCSSAVLASSFALFAPEAAQASFTLIDEDNDMLIEGIAGLEIDGSTFNVDFVTGVAPTVYSDGLSFDNFTSAAGALSAIFTALDGSEIEDQNGVRARRGLRVGYDFYSFPGVLQFYNNAFASRSGDITDESSNFPDVLTWVSFEAVEAPGGGGNTATTPEPSLIFGFITLGGLMLGSKRKTKG